MSTKEMTDLVFYAIVAFLLFRDSPTVNCCCNDEEDDDEEEDIDLFDTGIEFNEYTKRYYPVIDDKYVLTVSGSDPAAFILVDNIYHTIGFEERDEALAYLTKAVHTMRATEDAQNSREYVEIE